VVPRLRNCLGDSLLGLYLHGSALGSDFDDGVSDIDLLAVLTAPVDERVLRRLAAMHDGLVARRPEWEDRVEVLYIDAAALATFAERSADVVQISPGEPLHRTTTSPHWLMDLHVVRERGVALVGPPPPTLLPPVPRAELMRVVRANLVEWRDWAHEATTRRQQAYAVLTVCRNLYACAHGELTSKAAGARWAAATYPEWADLIERAG
jgi:hypothetical protein